MKMTDCPWHHQDKHGSHVILVACIDGTDPDDDFTLALAENKNGMSFSAPWSDSELQLHDEKVLELSKDKLVDATCRMLRYEIKHRKTPIGKVNRRLFNPLIREDVEKAFSGFEWYDGAQLEPCCVCWGEPVPGGETCFLCGGTGMWEPGHDDDVVDEETEADMLK